jgi:phenylacetate-CoA ligase
MFLRTIVDLTSSRRNLFAEPSELERLQIKKFRSILIHAYDSVPFYHERLKNAGIKPSDVQTIGDIGKIPLTTKKDLQCTPLSQIVARDVNIDRCVKSRTSGSTGLPLITLADKRTDDIDGAMWLRAFFENGMRLRDKTVEIRDPRSFHKRTLLEHFGILKREYVSIFDDVKAQAAFLAKQNPDIIESYPSSMELLANFFARQKTSIKPRSVFTRAELLDKKGRESITKVFETELFDYYGSSEIGLLSWECREHNGYHTNADNLIMEFVDSDGKSVTTGEPGEIVCTNLNNYAMPMIRYKQGDIGTRIETSCPCGIKFPMMRIIGGRKDDFLETTSGRMIIPTIFLPYPFENFERIEQFRVIQENRDKLRIQLVIKAGFDLQLLERARKEIQRVFGEDMQVEFEFLKEIARDSNGKLRKVISKIQREETTMNQTTA